MARTLEKGLLRAKVNNFYAFCLIDPLWKTLAECPRLYSFTPLSVTATGIQVGGVARYRCVTNSYTLIGPSTRQCLFYGTWSGSEPTCKSKVVYDFFLSPAQLNFLVQHEAYFNTKITEEPVIYYSFPQTFYYKSEPNYKYFLSSIVLK